MTRQTFTLTGFDGEPFFVRRWVSEPAGNIKALIQIAHGMAEHGGRYSEFAEHLVKEGYVVFASDHPGHGQTAPNADSLGLFPELDGWGVAVENIKLLSDHIRESFAGKPLVLLGHSMGSYMVREAMIRYGEDYDAIILSGSGDSGGLLGKIGAVLAGIESRLRGKGHRSRLMTALTLDSFNRAFRPVKTESDWLTRDDSIVRQYVEDPHCGFICSSGFFKEFLGGIQQVGKMKRIRRIPNQLPVLLISGQKDPVGKSGSGVARVYHQFRKAGLNRIQMKLFKDARHEILNEINRDHVYRFLLQWLDKIFK